MKKTKITALILSVAISTTLASPVFAASVPPESTPIYATEESIAITENMISGILTEVQNGLSYAEAQGKANNLIFHAVLLGQTNGHGYADLTAIARNAIFQYRDMYLRPDYYKTAEENISVLIDDLIIEVENGAKDYETARRKAYARIYQSVNPAFTADEALMLDTCYRDMPAVDSALFSIARKLLLRVQK